MGYDCVSILIYSVCDILCLVWPQLSASLRVGNWRMFFINNLGCRLAVRMKFYRNQNVPLIVHVQ